MEFLEEPFWYIGIRELTAFLGISVLTFGLGFWLGLKLR